MSKIKIKNLQFSYGLKKVLDITDIEFEHGKTYGIVGKNGVGKTTFFKAMTNIITNYKGSVLIDDLEVKDNLKVLSKVGIVLDNIELYKNRTGLFNLRYFGGLRGGFNEEKIIELARELEIADSLDKKVSTYSLGMNKKLILLVSLINDAEILILDEPFRGIDAKSVKWFKNYLQNLKNQGRTILISSHVQDDIESLSDKVLILKDGDFKDVFDLKDSEQTYTYRLQVSDVQLFKIILHANQIVFEEHEQFFKIDLKEREYEAVFKESVNKGVLFYQIKKENKYIDHIK